MTHRYLLVAVALLPFLGSELSIGASAQDQSVERRNVRRSLATQQAAGAAAERDTRLVAVAPDGTVNLMALRAHSNHAFGRARGRARVCCGS
jgi:hypothetical protein